MFCEGNEDVPPPSKAPFVRRRASERASEGLREGGQEGGREGRRGPFSKFTRRLRDESAGAIIFGEMHINILLMEGLELLLWHSDNILQGSSQHKGSQVQRRSKRSDLWIFTFAGSVARTYLPIRIFFRFFFIFKVHKWLFLNVSYFL